jgi:small subunit ribosomal protein S6
MKKYDALFILDIQGREENVTDMIAEIEKEIKAISGKVLGTKKMDRRKFESVAGRLDSGYYLGVDFELVPEKVEALRAKLALNSKIYRQFYLRSTLTAPVAEAAAAV